MVMLQQHACVFVEVWTCFHGNDAWGQIIPARLLYAGRPTSRPTHSPCSTLLLWVCASWWIWIAWITLTQGTGFIEEFIFLNFSCLWPKLCMLKFRPAGSWLIKTHWYFSTSADPLENHLWHPVHIHTHSIEKWETGRCTGTRKLSFIAVASVKVREASVQEFEKVNPKLVSVSGSHPSLTCQLLEYIVASKNKTVSAISACMQ